MNIKYYIVKNQDINNDGRKEDLILKYRGDKFLGALPLKDYVDIDDYFSKMPVIPQKYYVVYTFHDYNRDKIKDHIVHIFSGNNNNYILSVPINEFMKNAKAYDEYNRHNNTNIYNEELSKQYKGGKGKKGKKGKRGGNPDQLQYMYEKQPIVENKKSSNSLNDMEKRELQELRKQMKEMQMQNQQIQNQQMQYQQMQNQQMQNQQMQYQQMQYPQMQYPQMQTANNMFREPSRVDNTNSTLNKFMDATIAGGGLTLGSSIMNSVFDMFSGE